MIFRIQHFRNQKHLTAATNKSLFNYIIIPSTIKYFAIITNPPKGKPINKCLKSLDKVHTEIFFGDCVALGVNWYALLLVGFATRYCWLYGM